MSSVSAGRTAQPADPEGPTGALASWVHDVAFDDVARAIPGHVLATGVLTGSYRR